MQTIRNLLLFLRVVKAQKITTKHGKTIYVSPRLNKKNPLTYIALLVFCFTVASKAFYKDFSQCWRDNIKNN